MPENCERQLCLWRKDTLGNEKVYAMNFAKIYPLLVNKAARKGRTKDEVDEVTCWLTGYSQTELENLVGSSYGEDIKKISLIRK